MKKKAISYSIENAFRILGLPVTASTREAVRRVEEMQAFITIGQPLHYDTDFPWIGELQRSGETVKKALQVLENPNTKLEHLLSWFWAIDEFDNLAIDALKNDDVDRAVEIWGAAAQQKDSHHKKNLAALEQILAFRGDDSAYQHLKNSMSFWGELTSSGQLFNLIKNLDLELSKRITNCQSIQFVGSYIGQTAQLFLDRWTNENQLGRIGQFFDDLSESDLPPRIITSIKEDYVKPVSEEIDKMCGKFSDIKGDYEKRYPKTKKFFKKVNPYLQKIKQTGDSFLIENYGDKIGKVILDNAIEYWNNTYNWEKCKELCEIAGTVITGLLEKERLEKTIKTISIYAEPEKTWENLEQEEVLEETELVEEDEQEEIWENLEPVKSRTSRFRTIKVIVGILLGLAGLYLGLAVLHESDKLTSISEETDILRPTRPTRYGRSSNSEEIDILKQKIDDNRRELRAMESELSLLASTLTGYENQLERLKEDIEDAGRKLRRGLYVNEGVYHRKIGNYNSLVQKNKQVLVAYQTKYDEYNSLLDATNADIVRYNRLIGGK